MAHDINYKFVGWCQEGTSDKVWGVIFLEKPDDSSIHRAWWLPAQFQKMTNAKCVTFWGRRGRKLQTKLSFDNYDMAELISKKLDKGYKSVDTTHLENVYPEFQKDLEKTAIWSMLRF